MNNLTMENNMSEAKKLLEENKHIIDKGEEIFRKFHSEFISDDWDSQNHCIRCNKFLHKYNKNFKQYKQLEDILFYNLKRLN